MLLWGACCTGSKKIAISLVIHKQSSWPMFIITCDEKFLTFHMVNNTLASQVVLHSSSTLAFCLSQTLMFRHQSFFSSDIALVSTCSILSVLGRSSITGEQGDAGTWSRGTERVGTALSPAGSRTWPRSGIDNSGWCWSLKDAVCLVKLVLQYVGRV